MDNEDREYFCRLLLTASSSPRVDDADAYQWWCFSCKVFLPKLNFRCIIPKQVPIVLLYVVQYQGGELQAYLVAVLTSQGREIREGKSTIPSSQKPVITRGNFLLYSISYTQTNINTIVETQGRADQTKYGGRAVFVPSSGIGWWIPS